MKTIAAAILLSLGFLMSERLVTQDHLNVFEGTWKGTLTYLNYGDDSTLVDLPLESQVTLTKKGVSFVNLFTEPGGRVEKRRDSFYFKEDKVIFSGRWDFVSDEVKDLSHWTMELKSEGKDNNIVSDFKRLIEVTPERIVVRKMVRYEGTEHFFMRNRFVLEK